MIFDTNDLLGAGVEVNHQSSSNLLPHELANGNPQSELSFMINYQVNTDEIGGQLQALEISKDEQDGKENITGWGRMEVWGWVKLEENKLI